MDNLQLEVEAYHSSMTISELLDSKNANRTIERKDSFTSLHASLGKKSGKKSFSKYLSLSTSQLVKFVQQPSSDNLHKLTNTVTELSKEEEKRNTEIPVAAQITNVAYQEVRQSIDNTLKDQANIDLASVGKVLTVLDHLEDHKQDPDNAESIKILFKLKDYLSSNSTFNGIEKDLFREAKNYFTAIEANNIASKDFHSSIQRLSAQFSKIQSDSPDLIEISEFIAKTATFINKGFSQEYDDYLVTCKNKSWYKDFLPHLLELRYQRAKKDLKDNISNPNFNVFKEKFIRETNAYFDFLRNKIENQIFQNSFDKFFKKLTSTPEIKDVLELSEFIAKTATFIDKGFSQEYDDYLVTCKTKPWYKDFLPDLLELRYQRAKKDLEDSCDAKGNAHLFVTPARDVIKAIEEKKKTFKQDLPLFTDALRQTKTFVDKDGYVNKNEFDNYANLATTIGHHSDGKRILGGLLCVLGLTLLILSITAAVMTAFAASPVSILGGALGGSLFATGLALSGVTLTGLGALTLFKENKARPVEKEMQQVLAKSHVR